MVRRRLRGFSYLVLLLWISIGGVLLSALASHWSFESRREREEEFVFRAQQYQHAIESFVAPINSNGCSNLQQFPSSIDDLLNDDRCGMMRHHLRRPYPEPVARSTNWGLVVDGGGIRGVFSQSVLAPIRHVDGVHTYQDWKFRANPAVAVTALPTSGLDPRAVER